jgi:hypothetical protein
LHVVRSALAPLAVPGTMQIELSAPGPVLVGREDAPGGEASAAPAFSVHFETLGGATGPPLRAPERPFEYELGSRRGRVIGIADLPRGGRWTVTADLLSDRHDDAANADSTGPANSSRAPARPIMLAIGPDPAPEAAWTMLIGGAIAIVLGVMGSGLVAMGIWSILTSRPGSRSRRGL